MAAYQALQHALAVHTCLLRRCLQVRAGIDQLHISTSCYFCVHFEVGFYTLLPQAVSEGQ